MLGSNGVTGWLDGNNDKGQLYSHSRFLLDSLPSSCVGCSARDIHRRARAFTIVDSSPEMRNSRLLLKAERMQRRLPSSTNGVVAAAAAVVRIHFSPTSLEVCFCDNESQIDCS